MRFAGVGILLSLLASTACSTSVPAAYLKTGAGLTDDEKDESVEALAEKDDPFLEGLGPAKAELGIEGSVSPLRQEAPFFPDGLKSAAIRKLVQLNDRAIERDSAANDTSFSPGEIQEFVEQAIATIEVSNAGDRPSISALKEGGQSKTTVAQRLQKYLILYYKGKFVDRFGNKLAKPEIKKSIGNGTITGLETVILEAFYDSLHRVPVFYELQNGKKVWLNATGEEPSYAVVSENPKDVRQIGEAANGRGISRLELDAMQFLAQVAGTQSMALAGLVIRWFGALEGGALVVAGHFSVGDNDTLSDSVETFFEVSSRHATNALAYRLFRKHKEHEKLGTLLGILKKLNEALEERQKEKEENDKKKEEDLLKKIRDIVQEEIRKTK